MKIKYYLIAGTALLALAMATITGITFSTDQNAHETIQKSEGEESTKTTFTHQHPTVETYHPAECIHAAYSSYYCSICNKSYIVTLEPALGHSYDEGTVITPYTCTEDGTMEYTCTRCGAKKEDVLPASHTYLYNITKEATCTEDGEADSAICEYCGYKIVDTITIPKLGHDYTDTCFDENHPHKLYYKTCSRCNDTEYEDLDVDYTMLYGYIHLTSDYERGSEYAGLYRALYDASYEYMKSDEGKSNLYVYYNLSKFTENEIGAVYSQFVKDNPEFYFLDSYSISSACLNVLISSSGRTSYSRKRIKKSIDAVTEYAVSNLKGDTEWDTITNIHNYIRDEVTYDSSDSKDDHSIVGAFVNKKAVCDGYGKAFEYLCYVMGINAIGISGTSYEDTSKAGYHYWNYVECDGKWYGIDVTWDDVDDYYFMWWNLNGKRKEMYLMADSKLMLENHKAGTSVISEYQSGDKTKVSYTNRFNVNLPVLAE